MTNDTRRKASGPLAGVFVLDLTWHLAGPYCTMILADLGARVVKVERPGSLGGYDPGGIARFWFKGEDVHYIALNRNKESIVLDLKDGTDRARFLDLARNADVVVNNFRPGTMDRLGIGFDDLRQVNPKIINASLSAFGATGPDSDRPGVDLVIQAEAGGISMTGHDGGPPARAGIPIADLAGGLWTALAITAALREKATHGTEARNIDMSLFDTHLSLAPYFAAYHTVSGFVPGRQGSGGHSPTYGAFETSDGSHLVIAVIDQEPWERLCQVLGAGELMDDPRFASAALRIEHTDELRERVAKRFMTRSRDEWLERLQEAGVPAGAVNDLGEALAHPQVEARGMLVDIPYVLGDSVRLLASPIRMSDFEPEYKSPPTIGRDTERIIEEFGL